MDRQLCIAGTPGKPVEYLYRIFISFAVLIMEQLSDRIKNLSESQTLAMARKSRELKAQGLDIINLSLGEPDFNTPDFIKEIGKKAIDENFSKYTPVPGYDGLREAISEKFKRDNNLHYEPGQIVVSNGAKQSIANTVLSLVNKGDEVLLPVPYWVSYKEIVKLAEGIPVLIPTSIENDFKVTPAQLQEHITPKTKLLMFSSPCNPSGSVYTKEELKAMAEVIASHDHIFIMSDEIYEHIIFSGKHESIAQFDFIYDKVITINGVSKSFAMTGWRLGYLAAPFWIANACTKLQGQFTSAPCSIAQQAAYAAVLADPAVIDEMKDAFLQRRNLVLEKMKEIPGMKTNVPDGAFYVFPDVTYYFGKSDGETTIGNASDLCMYLLAKAKVALVTGEAFGDPNCIRFSYAASEKDIIEALVRIKEAFSKLH